MVAIIAADNLSPAARERVARILAIAPEEPGDEWAQDAYHLSGEGDGCGVVRPDTEFKKKTASLPQGTS